MSNQNIYEEIKEILEEEPELKLEFKVLKLALEGRTVNFSISDYNSHVSEFEDFVRLLCQLARIPKIKNGN